MTIVLEENPDIAQAIGKMKKNTQTLVGFAAETDHVIKHAQEKLKAKNLDMIVANDVTKPGAGFNTDTNIVTLITEDRVDDLPIMSKREVADAVINRIIEIRD